MQRSSSCIVEKSEEVNVQVNTKLQQFSEEIQSHLMYCLENTGIYQFPAIAKMYSSSIQNERILLMKELMQNSRSFVEEPVADQVLTFMLNITRQAQRNQALVPRPHNFDRSAPDSNDHELVAENTDSQNSALEHDSFEEEEEEEQEEEEEERIGEDDEGYDEGIDDESYLNVSESIQQSSQQQSTINANNSQQIHEQMQTNMQQPASINQPLSETNVNNSTETGNSQSDSNIHPENEQS